MSHKLLTPTQQQVDIIDYFSNDDNKFLCVQAGAGASKTTTLLMVAEEMSKKRLKGAYMAFNRLIVNEAKAKFSSNHEVSVSTIHSLAFRATDKAIREKLNSKKRLFKSQIAARFGVQQIPVKITTEKDGDESIVYEKLNKVEIVDLADKAIQFFCQSDETSIKFHHIPAPLKLSKKYPNNVEEIRGSCLQAVHQLARNMWEDIISVHGKVPFKHDHYLKMWELGDPLINAHYLMVDEGQDVNPVMLSIITKNAAAGRKVILVGDSMQSIYSFTGAVDALEKISAKGVHSLYLSKSFRFGKNIANVANNFLDVLESPLIIEGGAEREGNSDYIAVVEGSTGVVHADAILTRTNAGALSAFMSCIDAGMSPKLHINAKEFIDVINAINELRYDGETEHYELMNYQNFEEFKQDYDDEVLDYQISMIYDAMLAHGASNIKRSLALDPKKPDINILTAHKSKGCEWPTVMIWQDFKLTGKSANSLRELPKEYLRLCYVAVTRAMLNLDWSILKDYRDEIEIIRKILEQKKTKGLPEYI